MNYNFFLSNGSDSRLYNHTGDIINAFSHDGRGIRTRTDALCDVRRPYLLRNRSFAPKMGSSNSTIKGLWPSQYTPFIGVTIYFYLQIL